MTASTSNFASMGKEELRAACRAAGISYSKLNNDGMRAALRDDALDNAEIAAWNNGSATPEAPEGEDLAAEAATEAPAAPNPFGALLGHKVTVAATEGTKVVDGKKVDANATRTKSEARTRADKPAAPLVPRVSRKGYKIQKEREERNGVKRPSEGTVCGAVWSMFDALHNSITGLKAGDLPALADEHGWNRTNVSCEFYAWRKFNGISGRATV